MRPIVPVLASLIVAGCATTSAPPPTGRIQTTEQVNRGSVSGAATAPARDLNLLRTKIPPVLLEALEDPYKKPKPYSCAELVALITPLDEALGPDIDEPETGDNRSLVDKGWDMTEDTALGMMAGAAQDLIPLRSWVRKLTGAERHDRLVRAAITAGAIRRGYLKGLGEAKGCKSPATPSHIRSNMPVEPPRKGPKYPIR